MADHPSQDKQIALAALVRGPERTRVLRALARLIVEMETADERRSSLRDMAGGLSRGRRR